MGVRDIMRSEIVSVGPDADIEDIGNTMFSRGVGSVERVSAELRSITDVIEREGPTDHEG